MKQLVLLGLTLLCISNVVTGIHLRHESIEQRKKIDDKEKEKAKKIISELETKEDYNEFVNTLKGSLSKKKEGKIKENEKDTIFYDVFKTQLAEALKTKDNGVVLSTEPEEKLKIDQLKIEDKKLWWDNEKLKTLDLEKKLVAIPVKDLRPTQSEIGLQNSLDWAIKQKNAKQYFGNEPKMIGAPILTYNKHFVLDGHHRWSQLYMLNKEAKIYAYNLEPKDAKKKDEKDREKEKEEAVSLLRKLQLTIGAYFGTIPTSSGDGTVNVYADANKAERKVTPLLDLYFKCRFRDELKAYDACETLNRTKNETELKEKEREVKGYKFGVANDSFIKSFAEESKLMTKAEVEKNKFSETKKKVIQVLKDNVKEFIFSTIDEDQEKKPSRKIMPQTDGPSNFTISANISIDDQKDLIEDGDRNKKSLPAILFRLLGSHKKTNQKSLK